MQNLLYTHVLVLWIKGCQLFRNEMCYVTNKNPFVSGITDVTEAHKRIVYIIENIIVSFSQIW